MKEVKTKISVIIPAFNEESIISQTLLALTINKQLEIIVVDNGSTDRTAEIAEKHGVIVVDSTDETIAAVRNRGVKVASADILVFIDADVIVTENWHSNLFEVVTCLQENPMMVTGSRVQTNSSNRGVNKYWYSQLTGYEAPYINSGHLITTRALFEEIGGFSEDLVTAEDYDFCQKATKEGAEIYNNPNLLVIHEGYPDSIIGLVQRERWHGGQDVKDLKSFKESKIAWFAALNLVLLIILFAFTISGFYLSILVYFLIMYLVSQMLTIYKFGLKSFDYFLIMPFYFYFYLCGRSLAMIDRLFGNIIK